jgi:hypothetical protein
MGENWLAARGRLEHKILPPCANAWKKSNLITCISNKEGHAFTSMEEVQSAFVNYFQSLFTSDIAGDMSPCLQPLKMSVTEEMNRDLLNTFFRGGGVLGSSRYGPIKSPGSGWFHSKIFSKELECCRGGHLSCHAFWVLSIRVCCRLIDKRRILHIQAP